MGRILITAAAALALLCACAPQPAKQAAAPPPPAPPKGEPVVPEPPGKTHAPAGIYTLDHNHSTLVFRVSHMGFSRFVGQFAKLEGRLAFDPAHPGQMTVTATADPRSLATPEPPPGFRATLLGKDWLDAGRYPEIAFRSTKVALVPPNHARVTGDLTLHGVTKPIELWTTFNGGYPANVMDGARIGFSAEGAIRRSDFGIATGLPAPGTNLGVGDLVAVTLETEWNSGQPVPQAATAAPGGSAPSTAPR